MLLAGIYVFIGLHPLVRTGCFTHRQGESQVLKLQLTLSRALGDSSGGVLQATRGGWGWPELMRIPAEQTKAGGDP